MTRRMPHGPGADAGSAVIEFLVIGVGLLIPIAYLVACAATLQAAVFASGQAAREAARAFTVAAAVPAARAQALAAARLAFDDYGLRLPPEALAIRCSGGPCLAPGSIVHVSVDWEVELPWVPDGLAAGRPLRVPVTAEQHLPVDDFRSDA